MTYGGYFWKFPWLAPLIYALCSRFGLVKLNKLGKSTRSHGAKGELSVGLWAVGGGFEKCLKGNRGILVLGGIPIITEMLHSLGTRLRLVLLGVVLVSGSSDDVALSLSQSSVFISIFAFIFIFIFIRRFCSPVSVSSSHGLPFRDFACLTPLFSPFFCELSSPPSFLSSWGLWFASPSDVVRLCVVIWNLVGVVPQPRRGGVVRATPVTRV